MTIQKHCKNKDKSTQNICIATVVEISISILVVHSFSSNNAKHNNVRYDLLKERERKKCMILLFVCYPWMTFFSTSATMMHTIDALQHWQYCAFQFYHYSFDHWRTPSIFKTRLSFIHNYQGSCDVFVLHNKSILSLFNAHSFLILTITWFGSFHLSFSHSWPCFFRYKCT